MDRRSSIRWGLALAALTASMPHRALACEGQTAPDDFSRFSFCPRFANSVDYAANGLQCQNSASCNNVASQMRTLAMLKTSCENELNSDIPTIACQQANGDAHVNLGNIQTGQAAGNVSAGQATDAEGNIWSASRRASVAQAHYGRCQDKATSWTGENKIFTVAVAKLKTQLDSSSQADQEQDQKEPPNTPKKRTQFWTDDQVQAQKASLSAPAAEMTQAESAVQTLYTACKSNIAGAVTLQNSLQNAAGSIQQTVTSPDAMAMHGTLPDPTPATEAPTLQMMVPASAPVPSAPAVTPSAVSQIEPFDPPSETTNTNPTITMPGSAPAQPESSPYTGVYDGSKNIFSSPPTQAAQGRKSVVNKALAEFAIPDSPGSN